MAKIPWEHRTVLTVVIFLGVATLLLCTGDMLLVWRVLESGHDISSTSVAVLTSVTGLAGTALGSLSTLLVSTRPAPPPTTVTSGTTTVTAPTSAAVTVEAPADPDPNPPSPRRRRRQQP